MKKKKAAPKKKAAKKPAVKASAKKKTVKKLTINPNTFQSAPKMFRVEMEHPSPSGETMIYSFIPCAGRENVEEKVARDAMQELKDMGVGGRLVFLEGKEKETVTETWGSVERAAIAEKTETEALPKA